MLWKQLYGPLGKPTVPENPQFCNQRKLATYVKKKRSSKLKAQNL